MQNRSDISLFVNVPVCSFRKGYAREYLETEEVPPPSTIYGFLLSLAGEEDRYKYVETKMAYAVLKKPEFSIILRTAWRLKEKKSPPGSGANRRPDFQEILTGLELAVWVQAGELAYRIRNMASNPEKTDRYGGLCLGESRDLINDVEWFPRWRYTHGFWLIPDKEGNLPLPVWVDHVGSKGTVWEQFRMEELPLEDSLASDDGRWITIHNNL